MELTAPESNMNGSSHLSPMAWSSSRTEYVCITGGKSLDAERRTRRRRVHPKSCGIGSLARLRPPPCTDDVEFSFLSVVTAVKADSAIHLDPLCVLMTPRMLLTNLIRESTGGHCRRAAEVLCVFRRSMQALRAKRRRGPRQHDCECTHEAARQQRDHS